MSTPIFDHECLPAAPYYVTAHDTFMSGWGEAAGKTNMVCLPCESLEEAEIVAANARGRSDMRNVAINSARPTWNNSFVLMSLMCRDDADAWYQPGRWTQDD